MRVCTRCVMDTTDRWIRFDEHGVCNHCLDYDRLVKGRQLSPAELETKFQTLMQRIKNEGRHRQYDSILGISGGLDSSYAAYLAWKNGLRTLLVHMDNGWDSELAVKNIENIVRTTGFDYFNHVIDWEEFKDLQLAYLRASVVDVEVVTDHAIIALIYRLASRFRIRHILSGGNLTTEAIMPRHGWFYPLKNDIVNLLAIHQRFGKRPLHTYPLLGLSQIKYYQRIRGMRYVDLLNLVPYSLDDVRALLKRELGWCNYGGKHHESVFTKFYQAYILPTKFQVDKRKAHLSNLICSGQLTREQAIQRLHTDIYPPAELQRDYEFVIKKLGLTRDEFEVILAATPVPHESYPTETSRVGYRLKAYLFNGIGRLLGHRR